jgi:hypothetical protein
MHRHQLRKPKMKTLLFAISITAAITVATIAATSIAAPNLSPSANPNATASSATNTNSRVVTTRSLALSAAKVSSNSVKRIKVTVALHQISVDINNSPLNQDTAHARLDEATKIASAIENSISGQANFSDVTAIHVNYRKIDDHKAHVLKAYDFVQSPAGVFVIKKS